jgi:methyltransferase (TIGR00027 family)
MRTAARIATGGLADHAALRMSAVDDAVRDAVRGGCSQLVVLGAGLDARPWRMPELESARVLEVDHPATQAYKRERTLGRSPLSRAHSFVAVDFERDDLGERLERHGHVAAEPTHWLWEAVTMYLRPEAIDATLAEISARSVAGSRLTLTYIRPDFLSLGRGTESLAHAAFSVLGEPLVGTMTHDELSARLAHAGFSLEEDSDSADWARRYGGSALFASPFRAERLAVAVLGH